MKTIISIIGFILVGCNMCIAADTPPVIESLSDLDGAVETLYESLTNATSVLPPGDGTYEIAYGYCLFPAGSEMESSTNLFVYSSRLGVPAWTVHIEETQGIDRRWLYAGSEGFIFRTNNVPATFDPEQWVTDLYGEAPSWLDPVTQELWYNRRDRSRLRVMLSLVSSNNWPLLENAWADAQTNAAPVDPERIAFTDITLGGAQHLTLQLYAPTNPMPIEIYSRATLATNEPWMFKGFVNAAGPFDSWPTALGPGSAFFTAARGNIDSDQDGIPDGRETLVHRTDPVLGDSDGDGLSDRAELYQYMTDPNNPDCDNDSIPDGWEVNGGMNPFDGNDICADPDNDHLYNLHEYWIDSDPQVAATNNYVIADAMKAVDLSIIGLTVSAAIKIFSTQNHSATNYLRNTNCWAAAFDLTCCSPWNSYSDKYRAGTLISPRHVLFAAHYDQIPTNSVLRFVDVNNNVIERRLIAKKQHPDYPPGYPQFYPDFTVGLLDSDVPTNQISFAKVLPNNWRDFIGSGRYLPALCLDQEEKAIIADLVDIAQTNLIEGIEQILTVFDYPADPNRLNYSEDIVVGDSGNPAFLIVDSQLVLLSVWTYDGAGAGTSLTAFKDDINELMSDLGGGYQLTEIDLSSFSTIDR